MASNPDFTASCFFLLIQGTLFPVEPPLRPQGFLGVPMRCIHVLTYMPISTHGTSPLKPWGTHLSARYHCCYHLLNTTNSCVCCTCHTLPLLWALTTSAKTFLPPSSMFQNSIGGSRHFRHIPPNTSLVHQNSVVPKLGRELRSGFRILPVLSDVLCLSLSQVYNLRPCSSRKTQHPYWNTAVHTLSLIN